MTHYVWNGETFVDTTGWKRAPSQFPSIIRDSMDALVHPATGKRMDSKSEFRRVTRAHGMVELGTDATCQTTQTTNTQDEKRLTSDIAEAFQKVEQGYQQPPLDSLSDWGGETRMFE